MDNNFNLTINLAITGDEQVKAVQEGVERVAEVSAETASALDLLGASAISFGQGAKSMVDGVDEAAQELTEMGEASSGAAAETSALVEALREILAAIRQQTAVLESHEQALGKVAETSSDVAKGVAEMTGEQRKSTEATEEVSKSVKKQNETMFNMANQLQSAQRAWHQLTAAVALFRPAMDEATRLMDVSATVGKSVGDVVLLEAACREAGVSSVRDFEGLSRAVKAVAFEAAAQKSGAFAQAMQRHGTTLAQTRQQLDALTLRWNQGLVEAMHMAAPAIRSVSSLLEQIPVKALAALILGVAGVMTGTAMNALLAVARAIGTQTASWLANTAAINANTAARIANARTPVGGAVAAGAAGLAAGGAASVAGAAAGGAAAAGSGSWLDKAGKGVVKNGAGLIGIAGIIGSLVLNEVQGVVGSIGRVLASTATGAGIGRLGGPWGMAAGAVGGLAYGIYDEFNRAEPVIKATETSIKGVAAAAVAAKGQLADVAKIIEDWDQAQKTSLADRIASTDAKISEIAGNVGTGNRVIHTPKPEQSQEEKMTHFMRATSGQEDISDDIAAFVRETSTPEEGKFRAATTADIFQQIADERNAINDILANPETSPEGAAYYAKRTHALEEEARKLQELDALRQQLTAEQGQREMDLLHARQALEREDFLSKQAYVAKYDQSEDAKLEIAQELADFNLKQLDERQAAEKRLLDTADTAEANALQREAERLRLIRESQATIAAAAQGMSDPQSEESMQPARSPTVSARQTDSYARIGLFAGATGSASYTSTIAQNTRQANQLLTKIATNTAKITTSTSSVSAWAE